LDAQDALFMSVVMRDPEGCKHFSACRSRS